MGSRIISVIKNKNKREKLDRQRKRQDMMSLQLESAYKAKLYDSMRIIDVIFEDLETNSVIIEVPDKYTSQFMKAIYSDEMVEYTIVQIEGSKFEIKRKLIEFN